MPAAADYRRRRDRDCRQHGRTAHEAADHRRLRVRSAFGMAVVQADRAAQVRIAPAHVVEHGLHVGPGGREPCLRGRRLAGQRIDRLVVGIEHEDGIVVEIVRQPVADALVDPGRIEFVADMADRGRRGGDAVGFAQHALAEIIERAREQLPFVLDGDLVGALRGGEHGDDDADDGDGNDDADRHHDAQTRAVPIRVLLTWLVEHARESARSGPLSSPKRWTFPPGP